MFKSPETKERKSSGAAACRTNTSREVEHEQQLLAFALTFPYSSLETNLLGGHHLARGNLISIDYG